MLIYIPAKLGANGIAQDIAYVPSYTLTRWLADTGTYLRSAVSQRSLGAARRKPLTPLGVAAFLRYADRHRGLDAISRDVVRAAVLRDRALPVSFIPARLGFVLYLPLAGLALFAAVCWCVSRKA